jgi:hypothetical protein
MSGKCRKFVEFSRWLGYVALGIILVGVGNSLA